MSKTQIEDFFVYEWGSVDNPALICIQEWWGVTDTLKQQAQLLADEGYRVVVPDLYDGVLGLDKEEAHHLFSNLDWAKADSRMQKVVAYLRGKGAKKVGAIGFCMGGALSLIAAATAGVDAAAPCYGLPVMYPPAAADKLTKCPILLTFGVHDKLEGFSDPATVKEWTDKINAAGGQATLELYDDAGHGFLNRGTEADDFRKQTGDWVPQPETQDRAFAVIFKFFAENLKQ